MIHCGFGLWVLHPFGEQEQMEVLAVSVLIGHAGY